MSTTAQLRREITRLRERTRPGTRTRSEAERRGTWEARIKIVNRERTPKSVFVARSRLAWLRMVGKLSDFASAGELIEDILTGPDGSGHRQPPEERSRTLVEREVYAAVYAGEQALAHLELPCAWAEALEVSETLRDRFLSISPEAYARWWVERSAMLERGEPQEAITEHARRFEEPYGISEELLRAALGPDAAVLTNGESSWMRTVSLDDDMSGEAGWQIAEAIRRIEEAQAERRR